MFSGHLPKNRKFDIEYYYYDPAKEEREGKRITFKRGMAFRKAAKTRSLIWSIALFAIVLYAISFLTRLGVNG